MNIPAEQTEERTFWVALGNLGMVDMTNQCESINQAWT